MRGAWIAVHASDLAVKQLRIFTRIQILGYRRFGWPELLVIGASPDALAQTSAADIQPAIYRIHAEALRETPLPAAEQNALSWTSYGAIARRGFTTQ